MILQELDTALFYLINNTLNVPVLDPVMIAITRKPYLFFLAAVLLCVPKYRSKLIVPFILSLIAFGLSDLTGNFFKHLFERERPFLVLEHVNKLVKAGSFAFPSNHAANAFAFATVMSWHFRKTAPLFMLIAALTAYSRIYVGVHYPSDVLAGSLLGIGICFMVIFIYLALRKGRDGDRQKVEN